MDILYLLFIAPLEIFYKQLFLSVAGITDSYGAGLLVISLCNAIIFIPLAKLVATVEQDEKKIQQILSPQLESIRAQTHGAQKHLRIKRLYQRYGYHPAFAIRSAFGVFLQLPFLLAAYQMLSQLPDIKGHSLYIIADLSKPDHLLWGVNLLPLLMTAINLTTTCLSKGLTPKARLQAVAIAMLFAILLYNAPAALLIFWTTNNLIFLIKTVVPPVPFGFKPKDFWLKRFCLRYLSTGKENLIAGLCMATCVTLVALFCPAALFLSDPSFFQGGLYPELRETFAICLAYCIAPFFFWMISPTWLRTLICCLLLALTVMSLLFSFAITRSYGALDVNVFSNDAALTMVGIWRYDALAVVITILSLFILYATRRVRLCSLPLAATIGALLCYTGYALAYDPNTVIAKEPILAKTQTPVRDVPLLTAPKPQQNNQASKEVPALQTPPNTQQTVQGYVTEALQSSQNTTQTQSRLSSAHTPDGQYNSNYTGTLAVPTPGSITAPSMEYPELRYAEKLPHYNDRLFTFSRTEPNVLIFVLDMFTGGHMDELLQEDPTLSAALDGFTWYKDTVAISSLSIFSLPAVYGGSNYSPFGFNARPEVDNLTKWNEAYATLPRNFASKGYEVALANFYNYDSEIFSKIVGDTSRILIVPQVGSDYVGALGQKPPQDIVSDNHGLSHFLLQVALFRVSPHSLRQYIYDQGKWGDTVDAAFSNSMRETQNEVAVFASLPSIAKAQDTRGTLKIYYSMLPHVPWHLPEESLETTEDPYPLTDGLYTSINGIIPEHYFSERHIMRMMLRFFRWMKQEGVYDNTTIILVSDHCGGDSRMLNKAFDATENLEPMYVGKSRLYKGRSHSLLLVKKANSHGSLHISSELMTNADVPVFACEPIGGCPDITPESTGPDRERYHLEGDWRFEAHPTNTYTITKKHTLKGSMFNKDNWIFEP